MYVLWKDGHTKLIYLLMKLFLLGYNKFADIILSYEGQLKTLFTLFIIKGNR